jgi:hypothetical protein
MKLIAGSILILAAAVLLAARWIGKVLHASQVVGSTEADQIVWAMVGLAICGVGAIIWGATESRRP